MKVIRTIILTSFILFFFNSFLHAQTPKKEKGWGQINTSHFTIIFDKQDFDIALEISEFCEEVYLKVTNFFGSYPKNVLCIINNKVDTANGYFSPLPPVINLYVTSPSTPLISVRNKKWLRVLLTHELTHYVNLTFNQGIFYWLSHLFGKSISSVPSIFLPAWVVEGIAVKLETEFSAGGRGRNPFFEMKSRAEIFENNFYSCGQAAYSSVFPPSDRIYQAGYLLMDFLGRKYGNDVFVRVYKKYLKYPFLGFEGALKKVTGSSTKEIFAEMKSELENRYSKIEAKGGNYVSPDTYGNYYLPVVTKRGWILYRNTLNSEYALVLFNPKTKDEKILAKVQLTDYSSYSSSKDGKTIVFSALKGIGNKPGGYTLTADLYLLKNNDSKPRPLTNGKHLWQPAITPNGNRIIAIQKENQYSKLVNINPKTGKITSLYSQKNTTLFNPSFSPDGKQIAFVLNSHGKQNIYLLNRKGDVLNLTWAMKGEKYYPRFIDNKTITFSADGSGSLDLYQLKLQNDGSIISKICDDPVSVYSGLIIGKNIIYASYGSKGYCLKKKPLTHIKKINTERTEIPFKCIETIENKELEEIPENKKNYNFASFLDLPKLIFILPSFFYIDPLYQKFEFIPGTLLLTSSPTGKTSLDLFLSALPEPFQIKGNLQFKNNQGWIKTEYRIIQSYKAADSIKSAVQSTLQTLSFEFPLLDERNLNTFSYLSLNAKIMDMFNVSAQNNFRFSLTKIDNKVFTSNKIIGSAGISFSITHQGPPGDLVPRRNLNFSHSFFYPLFSNPLLYPDWQGQITISVPLPFKHQLIQFGSKWGRELTTGIPLRVSPRGFENNSYKTMSLIQGLDYIFTLGIMDIPLPEGFSLQGLAGGVHMEKEINFDTFNGISNLDPYIYLGTELTFKGGYMNTSGIGGVGLNFRFNTHAPEKFDPLKDIGFSIYWGTNSFLYRN